MVTYTKTNGGHGERPTGPREPKGTDQHMKNKITYAVAMKFLATDVEPAVIADYLGHALGGPE